MSTILKRLCLYDSRCSGLSSFSSHFIPYVTLPPLLAFSRPFVNSSLDSITINGPNHLLWRGWLGDDSDGGCQTVGLSLAGVPGECRRVRVHGEATVHTMLVPELDLSGLFSSRELRID